MKIYQLLFYEAITKTVYMIHFPDRRGSRWDRVQVGLASHFIVVRKMNLQTRLQRVIGTNCLARDEHY